MSSRYSHDVLHGVKYQSSEGQEKTRWTKCGAAFTSDKGNISIKLEYLPSGPGPVWLSLFEPKRDQENEQ